MPDHLSHRSPFSSGALQFCRALVVFLVLAPASGLIQQVIAQEKAPATYSMVASGTPLSDAFDAFIEQSGISIAFDIDLVKGKRAYCQAIDLEAEAVLRCLLKETGLTYIQLASGTYVLMAQSKPAIEWGEITGRVVDGASGEPLPNAHVLLADAGVGDVTNSAGRFAFSQLAPGSHRVRVSYIGYQDKTHTIKVVSDKNASIELGLQVEPLLSSPIVVNGLVPQFSSEQLQSPDVPIDGSYAGNGSQDVIKNLNTVIGLRNGDAVSDVHVQGGEAGEHQYRLDGAPVFLPISNGGIVGPFSPFALDKFTVHKAGYAASVGSSLSGVIDATHRLSSIGGSIVDVQVDPISANARAMGSFGDGSGMRANWMVAGRKALWSIYQHQGLQTHFDNWSAPDLHAMNVMLPQDRHSADAYSAESSRPKGWQAIAEGDRDDFRATDFENNYDFYDVHGALRLTFDPASSLHASFYRGGNTLGDDRVVQGRFQAAPDPEGVDERFFNFDNNYNWTNTVAQVSYERVLGRQTFVKWGGWYSQFSGAQSFNHDAYDGDYTGTGKPPPPDSSGAGRSHAGFEYSQAALSALKLGYEDVNRITEWGLRGTFDQTLGARHFLSGGIELMYDNSQFVLNMQRPRSEEVRTPKQANIDGRQLRLATFADHRYSISDKTTLDLGVRLTYLSTHEQVFAEPRLALRHDASASPIGPWAFRGAVGLYRQYVNQFDVSSVNINALVSTLRFWLPVDASQRPSKALHASGSLLFMPHPEWQLQIESYYKAQPHLLVIDYANEVLSGASGESLSTQSALLTGAKGFAYGTAVSLERKTKQLTTRFQYEYSVAERQIANRFDGASVSVPWNVPHRVVTSLSYRVTDQVTILGRLENKIGQSWAFRQAYYNFLEPNPDTQVLGIYDLSDPGAHKLPVISHLDFGIAFNQQLKNTTLQVRFDLSNILAYNNVEEWSLSYNDQLGSVFKVERPLTPFLPSMVVRLGF
ncbi:MAG: carboxypeptidase regulatory-like domain-containing protein [Bacteroidota bacterium]